MARWMSAVSTTTTATASAVRSCDGGWWGGSSTRGTQMRRLAPKLAVERKHPVRGGSGGPAAGAPLGETDADDDEDAGDEMKRL